MAMPPAHTAAPQEEALVADLEVWRREGVLRLRHLNLPALRQAAMASGLADDSETAAEPAVLQELVRSALATIGGSLTGRCAVVLLGLDPNTFDLAPNLLREEAAEIYGLSLARFRREPQAQVLTVVATKILELCFAHRARVERLAMERRHPADSRLAVKWLERFEAYFSIWTPMYGLGADLTAYRATLIDPERPWDRQPGTNDPSDPGYTQELQAQGHGTFGLFHYAGLISAVQRWMVRYGGLWLLSSAVAEVEARDAMNAVLEAAALNERDDSWLRTAIDNAAGELHPFLTRLENDSIGRATHEEWQQWLGQCECHWAPGDEHPEVEYFPTARYHDGIATECQVHDMVDACNTYCTVIEDEWLKVADWYKR